MPDGTRAYLTEAGSFGLFGHPQCTGLEVRLLGVSAAGVARQVIRERDRRVIGAMVGRDWYHVAEEQ